MGAVFASADVDVFGEELVDGATAGFVSGCGSRSVDNVPFGSLVHPTPPKTTTTKSIKDGRTKRRGDIEDS